MRHAATMQRQHEPPRGAIVRQMRRSRVVHGCAGDIAALEHHAIKRQQTRHTGNAFQCTQCARFVTSHPAREPAHAAAGGAGVAPNQALGVALDAINRAEMIVLEALGAFAHGKRSINARR